MRDQSGIAGQGIGIKSYSMLKVESKTVRNSNLTYFPTNGILLVEVRKDDYYKA